VPLLLRATEFAVFLMFVAWTVVFPLATLLSLLVTLPLLALLVSRPAGRLAWSVQA